MIVTIAFGYMEGEQTPNQCIYAHTQHLSGTRGTLAYFSWTDRLLIGLPCHIPTLEHLYIF